MFVSGRTLQLFENTCKINSFCTPLVACFVECLPKLVCLYFVLNIAMVFPVLPVSVLRVVMYSPGSFIGSSHTKIYSYTIEPASATVCNHSYLLKAERGTKIEFCVNVQADWKYCWGLMNILCQNKITYSMVGAARI